jgi:hypothetical protein
MVNARLAAISMVFAGLLISFCSWADQDFDPPGRVARINLAEGQVSVQPAGSPTWTNDVANRPLTSGDRVWADQNSRSELHIGSTAVRLGAETGVTLGIVDDHSVRMQISAGSVQLRVRALGADETFELTTPFAHVAVLTPGSYRVDVSPRGDEMRVATSMGQVAVTDSNGLVTVDAGRQARFHGAVTAAEFDRLAGGDDLDRWASERDRREDQAVATRYVSREMTGYEDLDDYGNWQTVGDYGPVWYPNVAVGWSPYRFGHWVWVSPWGWTWIDDAPWGFAPFHYGRWVYAGGAWGWAPGPRRGSPYYAPALVGWVGGFGVGVAVGAAPVAWFPLGWNEVYVPSYHASRNYVQTVNVTNIHVTNVTVVNEYYDRVRSGEGRESGPHEYRNYGVTGSVVATTRNAFAAGQAVNAHPAEVPHYDHPRIDSAAPNVAPGPTNYGHPATVTPRQEIFNRPIGGRPNAVEPGIGGNPPPTGVMPPRTPEYRPAPVPPVSNQSPQQRNEWRPGPAQSPSAGPSGSETNVQRMPAYRPAPSSPIPENRTEPVRAPEYRPTPTPPAAPVQHDETPRNEWRPAPAPEMRSPPPPPPAPPMAIPREAPRAAAPPAPQPPPARAKENKEERRDHPH